MVKLPECDERDREFVLWMHTSTSSPSRFNIIFNGLAHTPERGSKIVAVLVAVAVAVENQKRQNRDRDLKPRFKPRNRGRNIFLVSEFFSTLRVSRFAVAVAVLNLTNNRSLDSVNIF